MENTIQPDELPFGEIAYFDETLRKLQRSNEDVFLSFWSSNLDAIVKDIWRYGGDEKDMWLVECYEAFQKIKNAEIMRPFMYKLKNLLNKNKDWKKYLRTFNEWRAEIEKLPSVSSSEDFNQRFATEIKAASGDKYLFNYLNHAKKIKNKTGLFSGQTPEAILANENIQDCIRLISWEDMPGDNNKEEYLELIEQKLKKIDELAGKFGEDSAWKVSWGAAETAKHGKKTLERYLAIAEKARHEKVLEYIMRGAWNLIHENGEVEAYLDLVDRKLERIDKLAGKFGEDPAWKVSWGAAETAKLGEEILEDYLNIADKIQYSLTLNSFADGIERLASDRDTLKKFFKTFGKKIERINELAKKWEGSSIFVLDSLQRCSVETAMYSEKLLESYLNQIAKMPAAEAVLEFNKDIVKMAELEKGVLENYLYITERMPRKTFRSYFTLRALELVAYHFLVQDSDVLDAHKSNEVNIYFERIGPRVEKIIELADKFGGDYAEKIFKSATRIAREEGGEEPLEMFLKLLEKSDNAKYLDCFMSSDSIGLPSTKDAIGYFRFFDKESEKIMRIMDKLTRSELQNFNKSVRDMVRLGKQFADAYLDFIDHLEGNSRESYIQNIAENIRPFMEQKRAKKYLEKCFEKAGRKLTIGKTMTYLDVLQKFKFTPEEVEKIEKAYPEDLRELLAKNEVYPWAWRNAEKISKRYSKKLIEFLAENEDENIWYFADDIGISYSEDLIRYLVKMDAPVCVWVKSKQIKKAYRDEKLIRFLIEMRVNDAAWLNSEEVAKSCPEEFIRYLAERRVPAVVWNRAGSFRRLPAEIQDYALENAAVLEALPSLLAVTSNPLYEFAVEDNGIIIRSSESGLQARINPTKDLETEYTEYFLEDGDNFMVSIKVSTHYRVNFEFTGNFEIPLTSHERGGSLNVCQTVGSFNLGRAVENFPASTASNSPHKVYAAKINELLSAEPAHLKALVYSAVSNHMMDAGVAPNKEMLSYALAFYLTEFGGTANTTSEIKAVVDKYAKEYSAYSLLDLILGDEKIKEYAEKGIVSCRGIEPRMVLEVQENGQSHLKFEDGWEGEIGPLKFYIEDGRLEVENGFAGRDGHRH